MTYHKYHMLNDRNVILFGLLPHIMDNQKACYWFLVVAEVWTQTLHILYIVLTNWDKFTKTKHAIVCWSACETEYCALVPTIHVKFNDCFIHWKIFMSQHKKFMPYIVIVKVHSTLLERKMLHRHSLFPYTFVHPMHWEETRWDERESVLVWGSYDHVSDFCVGVQGCIAT